MKEPVHIAFCGGENYFQYFAVTIRSILENNPGADLSFHLLTDNISPRTFRRINAEFSSFQNAHLDIMLVDDTLISGLPYRYWTKYTWYRILLPDMLPNDIHKVLYLDADTLVTGDILPLFSMDMQQNAIAGSLGAENFHDETFFRCQYDADLQYVCCGVLLMNLDVWRREHLASSVIQWGKEHSSEIKYPDQDAINHICRKQKIVLPMKYGVIGPYFSIEALYHPPYSEELRESLLHPVIIHYANQNPWKKEMAKHPLQKEWIACNNRMRRPARRHYITKGWPFVKMIVWIICHPLKTNDSPTVKSILSRFHFAQ